VGKTPQMLLLLFGKLLFRSWHGLRV